MCVLPCGLSISLSLSLPLSISLSVCLSVFHRTLPKTDVKYALSMPRALGTNCISYALYEQTSNSNYDVQREKEGERERKREQSLLSPAENN